MRPQDSPAHIQTRVNSKRVVTPVPFRADSHRQKEQDKKTAESRSFRMACRERDEVVREGRVPAVFGLPPGHVAWQAIAGACRVWGGEGARMTRETSLPEVGRRIGRLHVWIVARSAPHSAPALARATAERQLLRVAYDFERLRISRR